MSAQRQANTSDLIDEERQVLQPLRPPEKPGGRPRTYPMREGLNGLQYGPAHWPCLALNAASGVGPPLMPTLTVLPRRWVPVSGGP